MQNRSVTHNQVCLVALEFLDDVSLASSQNSSDGKRERKDRFKADP